MTTRMLTTADLAMLPNDALDQLAPLAGAQLSTSAPCGNCGGFGKRLDPKTGAIVECRICGGTGIVTHE